MRPGTYFLNNSGSKFVIYPKPKCLVYCAADGYCKIRTVDHFEMFGNSAVAVLKYNGKTVKKFLSDAGGMPNLPVFFVNYQEQYR